MPKNAAYSLLEVTLALSVSAFCLIAIFGLLPAALKSNQAAMEQSVANGILSAVAADLRATPPTSVPGQAARSGQFGIAIPSNPIAELDADATSTLYFTNSGQCLQSPPEGDAGYRLTVHFLRHDAATRNATLLTLQASWPAASPPAGAAGSNQTFLALDRN